MTKTKYQASSSISSQVHRTSRMFRSYLNREFIKRGYNVTGEQFDVLMCLWEKDGQHQKQIADQLFKDKTTITRLVSSIEELRLAKRKKNPHDERQKLVYLTASGKKVMSELSLISKQVTARVQKGVAPAHLETCLNVLRHIQGRLSEELA